MLKEYSYGAVIYKIENEEPLFLLVKSKRSDKWGFPKGHIEESDTTGLHAAKREIFEETGIKDMNFVEGFKEEDIYIIEGTRPETKGMTTEKHSIYFLAQTFSQPLNYDRKEIAQLEWASIERAVELLYFVNQKNIITKSYRKIKGHI
ncbi:MAG: NUDIX domain-containing protein [Endomicrobium sp.]|jgi:8-oxo-dGTP pyrophosphatase MutT (NUDIX family)|nr:NUDIX domain-containing protein [Endomicrobium sp.]